MCGASQNDARSENMKPHGKGCAAWELEKVYVLLCLLRFLGSFVGHDWSKNHLFLPYTLQLWRLPAISRSKCLCVRCCVRALRCAAATKDVREDE